MYSLEQFREATITGKQPPVAGRRTIGGRRA
jgi:hypothetical protein